MLLKACGYTKSSTSYAAYTPFYILYICILKYDNTITLIAYCPAMAELSKSFHPYKMTVQTINKIF